MKLVLTAVVTERLCFVLAAELVHQNLFDRFLFFMVELYNVESSKFEGDLHLNLG